MFSTENYTRNKSFSVLELHGLNHPEFWGKNTKPKKSRHTKSYVDKRTLNLKNVFVSLMVGSSKLVSNVKDNFSGTA